MLRMFSFTLHFAFFCADNCVTFVLPLSPENTDITVLNSSFTGPVNIEKQRQGPGAEILSLTALLFQKKRLTNFQGV